MINNSGLLFWGHTVVLRVDYSCQRRTKKSACILCAYMRRTCIVHKRSTIVHCAEIPIEKLNLKRLYTQCANAAAYHVPTDKLQSKALKKSSKNIVLLNGG